MLIRKDPKKQPITYSPRYRTLLVITSLFLAFLLGLFVMPSKLKRDALDKISQQHRAVKQYNDNASDAQHKPMQKGDNKNR